MSEKVTLKEACELIAKWFNEVKFVNRTDWTGEEIFNASPTGELIHVFEYYEGAKNFFGIKDTSNLVKPTNPPIGTKFRDTSINKVIYWTGEKWVDDLGETIE